MINERGHIDDNGFVSLYWYDADGERTVKTSGDGTVVYVNSLFSGGNTQTAKFTQYVSPYLVASQGGKYTKHIYVGSQRIVSKLGDLQCYGADPRRIPYAGSENDNINVDYKGKYTSQQQSIKNNYAAFDVPYNGKDNDNYADGQGFCCEDIEHDTATRSLNLGQNDNYEQAQFYYHPDHLGSSSFITNLDGDVTQHIEYVPFGEVFIEERNNVWNTPYLFNAKELDEETGLYYYGARYYDSRVSLWLSTDPMQEKYPNISSYIYTFNNPVMFIDPDGRDVWEVNEQGEVVNRIKDKTQDAFYMVSKDANGNYQRTFTTDAEGNIKYNSLSFKYGTVESQKATSLNSTDSYDTYKVRGDANGTQMFEFMSQNTTVEWSQAKTGIAGDKGLNFLTTSHDAAKERGMSSLYSGQLYAGYTIRELNHNHPSNTAYPSGSFVHPNTGQGVGEWGGVGFARSITNNRRENRFNIPSFNIYLPASKSYINYDSNTTK